jgi:Protein of unknown function (DUF1344)
LSSTCSVLEGFVNLPVTSFLVAITLAMLPTLGETQIRGGAQLHLGGPTVEGQEVEGRITRVDPRAGTIRLDNGEEYLLPAVVVANLRALSEGTVVRLRYDVDGGRNLVTSVQAGL